MLLFTVFLKKTRMLFICSISMAISRVPLLPCPKRERLGGDPRTSAELTARPCTRHQLNSNQVLRGSGYGHSTEGPATELDANTYYCLATTSMLPEKMMARGTQVSPHQLTDPATASSASLHLPTRPSLQRGMHMEKGELLGGTAPGPLVPSHPLVL